MKKEGTSKKTCTVFITNVPRKVEELDDYTFDLWKNELKKELPVFWESMNNSRLRFRQ